MNKFIILALVMSVAFGAAVTNDVASSCISELTVPDQLSFTFTYAVQCNQFHNGLVNAATSTNPVDLAAWKKCSTLLKQVKGVSSADLNGFINSVNSCTTQGTASLSAAATNISNQVAFECIDKLTIPQEVTFAFNYGVDCNRFHNGLVNQSTSKNPVNLSDWKACRDILSEHFTDDEANKFYTSIDSCVNNGKSSASLMAASITNAVADACVNQVALPDELSFAFNYGVDCNKFHNGLVNQATANQPVSAANWKTCKTILASHFTDADAKAFYTAIDSCVTSGKVALKFKNATTVTNAVADACVNQVALPDELSFAFNYGVDCNKFHNGLVNQATANQPVSAANWKTCKTILASHFTDADAKTFYSAIDSCVTTGKATFSLTAATISNKVANDCINTLTIPQEVTFAFNYGVDCNKFHNGLVNESTINDSVSLSNWKVCRDILSEHFTDQEATSFFTAIDSCVNNGKTSASLMAATVTNAVADACVNKVTLPDELSFAFNYGVDCNKFHNGLVNQATANQPVSAANWKTCKTILASHFTDADAKAFYTAIDSCVTSGKVALKFKNATTVTNAVADACVNQVALPDELSFAFNYGVDCNKFHNGLVNQATANQPVSAANWKTCKTILASHFTDADAKTFYTAIDSCVTTGKTLVTFKASSVTNAVANTCVSSVALPDELSFAFNYGVDCNKFHNGLVNQATANQPVSTANWTTCKNILAEHFTDADAKAFYTAIDSCVTNDQKSTSFLRVSNEESDIASVMNTLISFFYQF